VTEVRGQFGNLEERERLPLEAVARGLMKTQPTLRDLIRAVIHYILCISLSCCCFL
jgi:hypothetical protein